MLGMAALVLLGCPGELSHGPGTGNPSGDTVIIPGGDSILLGQEGVSVQVDFTLGDLPPPPETGVSPDTALKPDSTPSTVDLGVSVPGSPCPCMGTLICINGFCRAQCSQPSGGCKATSNYPTTHACVATNISGLHVCIPGAAPGKSCGTNTYCYNKHICASINSGPYTCVPVCSTKGAKCGTGGVCIQDTTNTSCLFCTAP